MGLVEQIRTAQRERGWSDQQLLDKSGLRLDRTTLMRKLKGECRLVAREIEALATALDLQLVWPPKKKDAA